MAIPKPAEKCEHIKANGVRCGSLALTRNSYCYFHQQGNDGRDRYARDVELLPLEDAASIQLQLMQVFRALREKTYDTKTCALMLYTLQIAAANLKRMEADLRLPALELAQDQDSLVEAMLARLRLGNAPNDFRREPQPSDSSDVEFPPPETS